MDKKFEIKICMIIKFNSVVDSIDNSISYICDSQALLKTCILFDGRVLDLDSDQEFLTLKLDEFGNLVDKLDLDSYYVYHMFSYGNIELNGKIIYNAPLELAEVMKLAERKYEQNKNIIPYKKILAKKRERNKY